MKYKMLPLVMAGVLCISPVTAYAANTFDGWDESTERDAWDVLATTEWSKIQESLIFEQFTSGAKADVTGAVRSFEDDIREVMETESSMLLVEDAQVELMLAMLQILGGTNPNPNDPYRITEWFNPGLEDVSRSQSISFVLRRLNSAYRQHTNDPYASYSKNDAALQSVIQGVMYGSVYTRENAEYTLDNSTAYYEANEETFELRGVDPMKDFAEKVSGIYSAASITGNGQFTHPCPGSTVTSHFGGREDPIYGGGEFHNGIDFGASYGASTYAADDGVVEIAGFSSSAGNWIVIDHGNGLKTKYMHHSRILVSQGQTVTKGQKIGEVGSTGNSTGNHLHFQVELNGTPVNPENYL